MVLIKPKKYVTQEMEVGTRNNIFFGIVWKLSDPSSMIGSNLGNLEHFIGLW